MTIAINMVTTKLSSGTRTYNINFYNELINYKEINTKLYIYICKNYLKYIKKKNSKIILIVKPDILSNSFFRLIWSQFILPFDLKFRKIKTLVSLMNTSPLLINFFKIRSILGIHSNLPWTNFHLMPGNYFKKIFIKKIMEYSIYNSQKLIVDSDYANKEIKKILGLKHKDITTINLGVDSKFYKKVSNNFLEYFNYKQDYILSVMSCVKYHNILNILIAMKEIAKKNKKKITLVLVLQILDVKYLEVLASYIKTNNLEKNVIIFKNLKSEYLANLYKNAKIYIFSSYSEVFGYTTLEAMACGCPVLVSKTSCLPEINGKAAMYFDPDDINSIKRNILFLLSDKKLRYKLINKGYIHVKKFNTKKSFENTFKVINS